MKHSRAKSLGFWAVLLALAFPAACGSSDKSSTSASNTTTAGGAGPRIDSLLVFGGPPECLERPLCLGTTSQQVYGFKFKEVKKLDTGGPVTSKALKDDTIQVGELFTGSSVIDPDFVLLQDDKGLQPAFDDAFRAVREGQGRRAGEVGAAVFVRDVGELGEQKVQVRLVVAMAAGPAGGEDTGGAAQDVDAEAGVVGDGRKSGGAGQRVGLQERVLGEGDAGFLDVGDVGVGIRADEVMCETCVGEDRLQLGELSGVAGGEDQAGHAHQYSGPGPATASGLRGADLRQFARRVRDRADVRGLVAVRASGGRCPSPSPLPR